jgi:hypothetical protein
MVFCVVQKNFFWTTQELEYFFFFLSRKFFFQNLTLDYMTKTLNQIIFFSNIGNQNIFLEKNHKYNPPFKLNIFM